MSSRKQALRKREKIITWLIAIVVAIALFVSFVVIIEKRMKSVATVGSQNKMLLDVKYWLFYDGYTTPVITIKNLQNTTRKDCKVIANNKYIFEIKEIPSIGAGSDSIIINTNNLIGEDGTIFNSASVQIQLACIICKEPFYSSYCGNFSR